MPHRVEHSTGNLMKSSVSSVAVGVPRARQQEAPSLKYWLLRRAIRARQPRVLLRTNMYSCGRTGGRAGGQGLYARRVYKAGAGGASDLPAPAAGMASPRKYSRPRLASLLVQPRF